MHTDTTYQTVIGLEIHVQLNTSRKMFAQEGAMYGQSPNTQTSPTTLAHPGTMPTLNKEAINHTLRMGLACQADITRYNWFDRKNYCYPDLPKGFQITQDKTPLCQHGILVLDTQTGPKTIRIARIHLEEDTGKSVHTVQNDITLINFDRAGLPLIEIVTEPDLHTPQEASLCVAEIRRLVRYLDISNGNMEEGSLRCDANVSIMPQGSSTLGRKVELKNMNSMRHIRLAITSEIERQIALRKQGQEIRSETRSYDIQTGKTVFQRTKETLTDYRFFPEPDLSPFWINDGWISAIRNSMPTLPGVLARRFKEVYGLSQADIIVLIEQKETGLFFEAVCAHTSHYKIAANWVIGPIKRYLNTEKCTWSQFPITPLNVAQLANIVAEGKVHFSVAAQKIFPQLLKDPTKNPYQLVQSQAWQVNDEQQLIAWVEQALATYPSKVKAYQAGHTSLIGLFMGEVMKVSHRKAHPQKALALLKARLDVD